MSGKKQARKKARYSVDILLKQDEKIAQIAKENGEQKSDVIRRALSQFIKGEEYKEKGFEVGVFKEDPDGTVKRISFVTI